MLTRLKLALLRCNDPQYAVAATLRTSETRLSRIICGRLAATDDEKSRIAAFLGRSVEELFAPDDETPNRAAVLVQSNGARQEVK